MDTALFVGRFQPFHRAHLADVKAILEDNDKVIIAVGSSQYSNTQENPFSFEERKEMIEDALETANIHDFEIIPVPDIHNDSEWVEHVLKNVPPFKKVYTGNRHTFDLFHAAGYDVIMLKIIPNISSSDVRQKIAEGGEWKGLLTPPVVKFIERIDGVKRVKGLVVKGK
ncbi:nicotinamide-nucleotide adenylyltransferase [Candidatus Woesearchaeota archaeon]|nr:nicotinamide-nucleotide adenylyltransferase [Candidatus Woesearchaeota archaeon]